MRVGRPVEEHLVAQKLLDNGVCIVASPAYVKAHGTPRQPEDLAQMPTVAYASTDVAIVHWPFIVRGEHRGVKVDPVLTVNQGNALLEADYPGLDRIIEAAILPEPTSCRCWASTPTVPERVALHPSGAAQLKCCRGCERKPSCRRAAAG